MSNNLAITPSSGPFDLEQLVAYLQAGHFYPRLWRSREGAV
ncbi:MAG TPA: hypothetical protein PKU97_19430 [Kofleriaceae bacterium]|nr:hypothetical protein [Kofleriaceae bacterium]